MLMVLGCYGDDLGFYGYTTTYTVGYDWIGRMTAFGN